MLNAAPGLTACGQVISQYSQYPGNYPRPGHGLIVQTQFQQIDFHRRVSAALSSVPPGSAGIRSWDNFVQLPQLQLVNC